MRRTRRNRLRVSRTGNNRSRISNRRTSKIIKPVVASKLVFWQARDQRLVRVGWKISRSFNERDLLSCVSTTHISTNGAQLSSEADRRTASLSCNGTTPCKGKHKHDLATSYSVKKQVGTFRAVTVCSIITQAADGEL